jgi:hypothetical protein
MFNKLTYTAFVALGILFSKSVTGQTAKDVAITDFGKRASMEANQYLNDNAAGVASGSYLFKEVEGSGYDLLSANATFTDKDQVQKVGFSPLRVVKGYYGIFRNLRINATNNKGALTAGLSIGGDNSAYESRRADRIWKSIASKYEPQLEDARPLGANETAEEYEKWEKTSKNALIRRKSLDEFDERRLKSVFKWSFGYNSQFFSVLSANSKIGNFDSTNYYGFKGHNLTLNTTYSRANGKWNFSATYNFFHKRKSADSLQKMKSYNGYSLSGSRRIIQLISDENLKERDFYKNSLFIPSIYLGISLESQIYMGKEADFAEDNLKRTTVYSGFIDIAISPASQFRLAFPVQRTKLFDTGGSTTALVAVLQYNFKLINLN